MGESTYVSGSERRILRKSMTFAIEVELNQQYDMLVLEMATERGVPLSLQTILKLQVGHHGRRHDDTTARRYTVYDERQAHQQSRNEPFVS